MLRSRIILHRLGASVCVVLLAAAIVSAVSGCAQRAAPASGRLPTVDHILLEVSNLNRSIAFYQQVIGLRLQSDSGGFAMLEAGNAGIYLWDTHWRWEKPSVAGQQPGYGMYPHFKVANVAAVVNRARQAGYKIIQKPITYSWGTEAFIRDPSGYIVAIVN